jgi:hypothetical protein
MRWGKPWLRQKAWPLAALGAYLITGVVLVGIEWFWYAHAVKTAWLYILLFPALSALMWFIREDGSDKPKPSSKRQKISNAVALAIVLLCSVFIAWVGSKDPYDLRLWLYFGFLAAAGIAVLLKKGKPGWFVQHSACKWAVMMFASVLVVTGVYLALLQPASVGQAQREIVQQAYTQVQLKGHYESRSLASVLPENETDTLGYYLFSAQKDGEEYGVLYSVRSRAVAAAVSRNENDFMSFLLQYSQTGF